MAAGQTIIVPNGVTAGSPFTVGRLVYVSQTTPTPELTSFNAARSTDGAVEYTSVPNSAGTYPSVAGATETFRVLGGAIIMGTATDTVEIGRAANSGNASATNAIAIGAAAANASNFADVILIGANTTVSGQGSIAIGESAGMTNTSGIIIGQSASASGNGGGSTAVVIGNNANATMGTAGGTHSVVVGDQSNSSHPSAVVLGYAANASFSSNLGQNTVTIGDSATSTQAGTTVIGGAASTVQTLSTVIGSGATATGAFSSSIVIGQTASATATQCIVLGVASTAAATQEVIIGHGGASIGANTMQLGAANTIVNTVVIGAGDTLATPAAKTVRFTNATGSNNAAGNATIAAPRSTGNATGAQLILQVGQPGASGSTLQSLVNALVLDATSTAIQLTAGGTLTIANDGNLIFDDSGDAFVSAQGQAGSALRLNGRGQVEFYTNGAAGASTFAAWIDGSQNIISGGSGSAAGGSAVYTMCFNAATTEPTTSTDKVHIYGFDRSAGNRAFSCYQEAAVIAVGGAATNEWPVRINGTNYMVQLRAA